MAVLTDSQRHDLWAQLMRDLSGDRESLALGKGDLRAALDAVDGWVETNQAAFHQALPAVARTGLTAQQKARLLRVVVSRRFEVS